MLHIIFDRLIFQYFLLLTFRLTLTSSSKSNEKIGSQSKIYNTVLILNALYWFCEIGREILRYFRLKKSFKEFFEYMQDSWLSKKIGGMSLHRAIHFQTLEHPFACLNSSCCFLHLTYYLCLQKPSNYTKQCFEVAHWIELQFFTAKL